MTSKFLIGKIGKTHGLKGYAYIHIQEYIKDYFYSDILIEVDEEEIFIEEIKKHLKDRYLIKFRNIDTINQIENYRDKNVYLNKKSLMSLNTSLPWPEMFVGEEIITQDKRQPLLINYYVSNLHTSVELSLDNKVFIVPYDINNFIYNGTNLLMIKSLFIYNPTE